MIQVRGLLIASAFLVCAATTSATGEAADKIPDLGSRRELFVDRFLIDKMHGTELRLHAPREMGPVLHLNKPWEGPQCAYTTVLKDKDLYRMYYRGHTAKPEREFTCYAESRDGVTWTRPELGLVEVEGSKKNNLILGGLPECHNFAPFLDTRPGIPADQRYKALGGPASGLTAWTSADGLRWQKLRGEPVISKKQVLIKHRHLFDSQNVAFWSETEKCYVCYFRIWDGVRRVGRTTSADFIHWQPGTPGSRPYDRLRRHHRARAIGLGRWPDGQRNPPSACHCRHRRTPGFNDHGPDRDPGRLFQIRQERLQTSVGTKRRGTRRGMG